MLSQICHENTKIEIIINMKKIKDKIVEVGMILERLLKA
jgi:hypothetical protein